MPIETDRQQAYIDEHPEYAVLAKAYYWSAPFGETTYNRPVFWLPTNEIFPNPWNPNVEKPKTFDGLVANVTEVGFAQNIQVISWDAVSEQVETDFDWFTADYRQQNYHWVDLWNFMIIGGEHRVNAAVFKDMDTVPCVIMVDMTEADYAQFQTMRFNILAGQTDPERFTKMVDNLLRQERYSKALLSDMFGFVNMRAFEGIYLQARQSLPKPLRRKLDKVKKDIKTVDQLANVIHGLMASHGDDLSKHSFMMFPMAGRIHLMVDMDKSLQKQVKWLTEHVRASNSNMTDLFNQMLAKYKEGTVG